MHCSRCRFETSRQQEVCCTQNRLPVFHGDVGSFLSGASRFATVLTDRAITIASNGNPQPVELRVAFRDSAPKHKCFSFAGEALFMLAANTCRHPSHIWLKLRLPEITKLVAFLLGPLPGCLADIVIQVTSPEDTVRHMDVLATKLLLQLHCLASFTGICIASFSGICICIASFHSITRITVEKQVGATDQVIEAVPMHFVPTGPKPDDTGVLLPQVPLAKWAGIFRNLLRWHGF
eukprot:s116_g3.t2